MINSHYATTSDVGTVGFSRGLNENGVSSKSRSDGLETPCVRKKGRGSSVVVRRVRCVTANVHATMVKLLTL